MCADVSQSYASSLYPKLAAGWRSNDGTGEPQEVSRKAAANEHGSMVVRHTGQQWVGMGRAGNHHTAHKRREVRNYEVACNISLLICVGKYFLNIVNNMNNNKTL